MAYDTSNEEQIKHVTDYAVRLGGIFPMGKTRKKPAGRVGKLIYQTQAFDNFSPSILCEIMKGNILIHPHQELIKMEMVAVSSCLFPAHDVSENMAFIPLLTHFLEPLVQHEPIGDDAFM